MNSFRDNKGRLWVACTECERGANGTDEDKCATRGAQSKKFTGCGCFCGTLVEKFQGKAS